MPRCIVRGCSNTSSAKSFRQQLLEKKIKITFHKLPSNVARRQLWLTSLQLEDSRLPKDARVCSQHFRSEDLDTSSLSNVRLREHAVPDIQNPGQTVLEQSPSSPIQLAPSIKEESEPLKQTQRLASTMNIKSEQAPVQSPKETSMEESSSSTTRLASTEEETLSKLLQEVQRLASARNSKSLHLTSREEEMLSKLLQEVQKLASARNNTSFERRDQEVQASTSCADKFTRISPERLSS